jgi:F-type H+-transporting ATPase subunit b
MESTARKSVSPTGRPGAARRPLRSLGCITAAAGFVLLGASDALAEGGNIVLLPTKETLPLLGALLVFFVLLIWPVNRLLLKPLLDVLEAREDRIAGTRARAEKLAADADAVLKRYEDSIREARGHGERDRKDTLASARTESSARTAEARGGAEQEIEQARAQIASELASARSTLRTQAEALASEAASTVLGRELS